MTIQVTEQSAFVVSTQLDLNVAEQSAFVTIFPGSRLVVAEQSAFAVLYDTSAGAKRRRIVTVIAD